MLMHLKYSEILRQNAALSKNLSADKFKIAILSNVVVAQAKEVVEYTLRSEGISAEVTLGDYDNIVQDSQKYKDSNLVLIFWEAHNIVDGLHYKIELYTESQIDALVEKTTAELDFVFRNLDSASLVLLNRFTAAPFSNQEAGQTNLDKLCTRLNEHIQANTPHNVRLIDIDKLFAIIGVDACIDFRYFYSSKAPYTLDFIKAYAARIKPFAMTANGKSKKAIILDCDNTLWKGVLGEDGCDGIEMSSATKDGAIFAEVQGAILSLAKRGILIGLCSKNNPQDVDEVLRSHPDMQLRDEHISVKRVNWNDKASNIRDMALELNIGLDSIVVVDDSSFETNLIREHLPEVTVLQVPDQLHLYPAMLRANTNLFLNLSPTAEDANKQRMYKDQARRRDNKLAFADLHDYLASLETKVTVYRDDISSIPRVAQLTQKTNQFNLTTIRCTEADIASLMRDGLSTVFAFSVADKFGDSGITGACVVRMADPATATIETFLMSCRILGRNIEYLFMDWLIAELGAQGIRHVKARYIRTHKNAQVANLFDKCSFFLSSVTDQERNYSLDIADYQFRRFDYMEIQQSKTTPARQSVAG
jgi:FkbH-like protein